MEPPLATTECSELLSGPIAGHLSPSALTYLRLIESLTDQGLSAPQIVAIRDSQVPVDATELLTSAIAEEKRHVYRLAFQRLMPEIERDWEKIRSDLNAIASRTQKAQEQRHVATRDTAPVFALIPTEIPELPNLKGFNGPYFYVTADGVGQYLGRFYRHRGALQTDDGQVVATFDESGITLRDAITDKPVWTFEYKKQKAFAGLHKIDSIDIHPYRKPDGRLTLIVSSYIHARQGEIAFHRDLVVEIDYATKKSRVLSKTKGKYTFFVPRNSSTVFSAAYLERGGKSRLQVRDLSSPRKKLLDVKVPREFAGEHSDFPLHIGQSVDGTVYVSLRGPTTLRIYNLRTLKAQTYRNLDAQTMQVFDPTFGFVEGDNGHLWFVPEAGRGKLYVVDVEDQTLRELTSPLEPSIKHYDHNLVRTPDGRAFAVANPMDGEKQIHLIALADGATTSLPVPGAAGDGLRGPWAVFFTPAGWWHAIFEKRNRNGAIPMQIFGPPPTAGR